MHPFFLVLHLLYLQRCTSSTSAASTLPCLRTTPPSQLWPRPIRLLRRGGRWWGSVFKAHMRAGGVVPEETYFFAPASTPTPLSALAHPRRRWSGHQALASTRSSACLHVVFFTYICWVFWSSYCNVFSSCFSCISCSELLVLVEKYSLVSLMNYLESFMLK